MLPLPTRVVEFDRVIGEPIALLPPTSRLEPEPRLNGLFSMTPDNLPLVGATSIARTVACRSHLSQPVAASEASGRNRTWR